MEVNRTYKFFMRTTQPDADGNYPVYLQLTRDRKRAYIALKIYGERDRWDDAQERFVIEKGLRTKKEKEANEQRRKDNDLIDNYNQKVKAVISQFEHDKKDWTINQFKNAFLSRSKQGNFNDYLDDHIQTLKETGHTGNANCYASTQHILTLFDKKLGERTFGEIDIKYVKRLDVFLQKRGNSGNTRKYYFKALRAILNKALQDGEGNITTYPFGTGGFKVSELEEKTAKRFLPVAYLEKLKSTSSKREVGEYARNLFLFSYYCFGMSFIDMALLKHRNLVSHDGELYLVYKREKEKNKRNTPPIQIRIKPEIEELIGHLRQFKEPIEDYLLPVVTINHFGEKLYKHITNRRKRYVGYLKDLATEFEFDFNLTSYVSRHTMAMQLQNNKIPREVISQVMGHQNLKTTNVYLDSLDSSVIDQASKVL
ncbi:site-specific integrase [Maribellus mangrovi]|uniref:site-specific integrase n=1 Tax=Maribellus mangrovi TaxID=3133146 RepID=UPI0030EBC3C1